MNLLCVAEIKWCYEYKFNPGPGNSILMLKNNLGMKKCRVTHTNTMVTEHL